MDAPLCYPSFENTSKLRFTYSCVLRHGVKVFIDTWCVNTCAIFGLPAGFTHRFIYHTFDSQSIVFVPVKTFEVILIRIKGNKDPHP
jgi:hypothetical protein